MVPSGGCLLYMGLASGRSVVVRVVRRVGGISVVGGFRVGLTDARVVVDDGEDAVAAFLHVVVGTYAAEEWGHSQAGPSFAALLPGHGDFILELSSFILPECVLEKF